MRSDHLPAYGYGGVATPAIDALRRDGVLFERAYAHVPLTLPSHASLLSGLLPTRNGVRDNVGYTVDTARWPCLPCRLREAGYATGAAVSSFVLRFGARSPSSRTIRRRSTTWGCCSPRNVATSRPRPCWQD